MWLCDVTQHVWKMRWLKRVCFCALHNTDTSQCCWSHKSSSLCAISHNTAMCECCVSHVQHIISQGQLLYSIFIGNENVKKIHIQKMVPRVDYVPAEKHCMPGTKVSCPKVSFIWTIFCTETFVLALQCLSGGACSSFVPLFWSWQVFPTGNFIQKYALCGCASHLWMRRPCVVFRMCDAQHCQKCRA
jgi:hypothetical protein